ncbi:MAG: hypothetical protein WCK11_04515 [Candidatus Falkowbacteria bacterium]
MTGKDIVMDFVFSIFSFSLIAGAIYLITVPDSASMVVSFLKAFAPVMLISGILFFKLSRIKKRVTKSRQDSDFIIILRLTYWDKIKSDILALLLPLLMSVLVLISGRSYDSFDLMSAIVVYLIMIFWQKTIFAKTRDGNVV